MGRTQAGRRLLLEGGPELAPSTITGILRRHGLLNQTAPPPRPFQRLERAAPNELWQMDFKGHFPFFNGARCHPLTVLDDHSRSSLVLQACADERGETRAYTAGRGDRRSVRWERVGGLVRGLAGGLGRRSDA